jgi:thiamine pyrophosphate-dependent acetolactate synthase large subunit-like protein
VTLGLVGDPKPSLQLLGKLVMDRMTDARRSAAAARVRTLRDAHVRARSEARARDEAVRGSVPLHLSAFAEELAGRLPADAILFDEAITHSPELCRWIPPDVPGQFFQTPGGTLGVGIPSAIGIKVAYPERTVIGFSGDGGAMMVVQALWTAAHHRIAAKFVICNNHSYRILKLNLIEYWRQQGRDPDPTGFPPSFDLSDPDLDYVTMARGMGVNGIQVAQPSEIAPAIRSMLEHDGPFLIDLVIDGSVP